MIYTQGIRKIFHPQIGYVKDFEAAAKQAENCGFTLMVFNGTVYVEINAHWYSTPLKIQDFEAS